MTKEHLPLEELSTAWEAIIAAFVCDMPDDHRRFLLSFERGVPEWEFLGLEYIPILPAIRWLQLNLDKLGTGAAPFGF